MTPKQESQLRLAWHGELTIDRLAKRFGLTAGGVHKFWQREKSAGRLPTDQARPHFADKTTLPCATAERVIFGDEDAVDDIEASERIAEQSQYYDRRASDHLVEALRLHHADLVDAQTVPAGWLRFDAKGAVPPSHDQLMAMARSYDRGAR